MDGTGTNTITSLVELLKDPACRADPYPLYRRLRDNGPTHRTDFGATVLTAHEHVAAGLRDNRLSSSNEHQPGWEQFVQLAEGLGMGRLIDLQARLLLFMDPPDHTRLRRLAGKAFTPRSVEAMRSHIDDLVDQRLDAAIEAAGGEGAGGPVDVISELAHPLPVTVICEMLGVPTSDRHLFPAWTDQLVKALDPSDDVGVFAPAAEAAERFQDYFVSLIAERRADLGDDLLSELIRAEEEGDRLTTEELMATVILLFVAGQETTVNLVGNGLHALLCQPGGWQQLVADPALLPSAIEELLRFDSPVQLTNRHATEDLEVGGCRIAAGEEIILLLGAANRDPAAFEAPDELRLDRPPVPRHVAFGGGIHACLGAPLARAEGQAAFAGLLRRLPGLVAAGAPERKPTVTLRGFSSLPVGWSAPSS